MLDSTTQRVLGVLIEKELAVPDSYPLTEAALLAGCNQKSNREPPMDLEQPDVDRAITELQGLGYAARVEGARATRYRQRIDQTLGLDAADRAVLAELLVRGPQAPGALKSRVARMQLEATPDGILEILHKLAERSPPLVEKQARRPRERDWRWAHCFGPGIEWTEETVPDVPRPSELIVTPTAARPVREPLDEPEPPPAEPADAETLTARIETLERVVDDLRAELAAVKAAAGLD